MKISESLLREFDQDAAMTKTMLERCPEAKFGFKPHARSWDLIALANHLASIPRWTALILKQDEFDVSGPNKQELPKTSAELLAKFEKNIAEGRAAIAGATDEDFAKTWALKKGDHTIFTMPKAVCLRSFVFSHGTFHRGQFAVYLRLIDVPVPALYGPSADEGSF